MRSKSLSAGIRQAANTCQLGAKSTSRWRTSVRRCESTICRQDHYEPCPPIIMRCRKAKAETTHCPYLRIPRLLPWETSLPSMDTPASRHPAPPTPCSKQKSRVRSKQQGRRSEVQRSALGSFCVFRKTCGPPSRSRNVGETQTLPEW